MINIKDHVKNRVVSFLYYRDGELWYTTELGFVFPVPINDIGTATFLVEDKAILFMRYILAHAKELDKLANASRFQ